MIPLWPLKSSYLLAIIDDDTLSIALQRQAQAELDRRLEAIGDDIDT